MRRLAILILSLAPVACGVDVAVSTATTAKLQAEQAKQAKQARESAAQITQQLEASSQAMAQRTAEMSEEKR